MLLSFVIFTARVNLGCTDSHVCSAVTRLLAFLITLCACMDEQHINSCSTCHLLRTQLKCKGVWVCVCVLHICDSYCMYYMMVVTEKLKNWYSKRIHCFTNSNNNMKVVTTHVRWCGSASARKCSTWCVPCRALLFHHSPGSLIMMQCINNIITLPKKTISQK